MSGLEPMAKNVAVMKKYKTVAIDDLSPTPYDDITKLLREANGKSPDTPMAVVTIGPSLAMELLEHNKINRPLSDAHVKRIAGQIIRGKWKFNGDTIKVSSNGNVVDGQHRLWAVITADKEIETVLITGIDEEAFATIDTLKKARNGGDVIALLGVDKYRNQTSTALTWLIRYQRKVLPEYKAPKHRIENSDIEQAYKDNPAIEAAVEKANKFRRIINPAILGFIYYVVVNRNPELADRLLSTLENPASISINDPFFKFREYLLADHHQRKEPLVTIALAIKAANAANKKQYVKSLRWMNQGVKPEPFPKLEITKDQQ